jgi:hypothetical protein
MPTNQYEIPQYGGPADKLHGWLLEAVQEGQAWLSAQKQAQNWEAAVSLMEDGDAGADLTGMSNTTYPKAKRIARELVASLASFRHEGQFNVLWDNTLYDQAHLLSDLDMNWYLTTQPGEAHRSVLQQAVIKGTGYWVEEWDKDYWGPGKGDIRLSALDPADVTFVQLPRDRDIQRAYAVIIRYELPINLARRIYGPINAAFAQQLVPDQQSPSWLQKGLEKVQQFLSPALRVAGRTRQSDTGAFPTVNIYHAYTMDGSRNEGFEKVTMGAYKTNWSYDVPVLGGEMATGIMNPATGSEWTRPAKWEDCQLFPLRRLSIWSSTAVAYDGSSPWWHGDVPVARTWFNDLPWNALGGSLISDIKTMQGGITALMRGMEDSAAARLDPPAIYDDNIVSSSWAKAFNPRMAGVRAAAPLSQGSPITYPVLPGSYDVPQWIPAFMDAQENRMDYVTGVRDLVAMAKAKQVPGADTLEKLMEMAGPIMHDMVGALEKPLVQLGEWRKAYYFQFYNTARIVRTLGPDQYDLERWKYGPEKIDPMKQAILDGIQAHGSYQFRPEMLSGPISGTPQQRNEQMRRKMTEFRYEVTESGINEIHRMTTKLFYLQLMKEGFPISWWTFAKIAKVPNFGPPPDGTNNEMERWVAQQHMKIELQGELQKELAMTQIEMGGQGGPAPGGKPTGNGEPPPIPNLGEEQRGRPQSYQRPPRLVQKDHGARSTVTTA